MQAYLALPNRVEGILPTELGLLLNLRFLDLVNMMSLEDSIVSQLLHFSSLSMLRISNSFTDDITFSSLLSFLPTNLESLYLGGSNIKGLIPKELSPFDRITSLEIVGSGLSGTLPSDVGLMTELRILRIISSLLEGNIPSEIGNLSHLTCLDLSYNQFSILLPSEVSKLTNLISYCP
jgi:Leucine-rich repeat (LRR) protein